MELTVRQRTVHNSWDILYAVMVAMLGQNFSHLGPLLLTWFNLNSRMDK